MDAIVEYHSYMASSSQKVLQSNGGKFVIVGPDLDIISRRSRETHSNMSIEQFPMDVDLVDTEEVETFDCFFLWHCACSQ